MKNIFLTKAMVLLLLTATLVGCSNADTEDDGSRSTNENDSTEQKAVGQGDDLAESFEFPVLKPVDEASKDPSLAATIKEVKASVEARNVEELMSHIGDEIMVSYGEEPGKERFKKYWELNDNPEKSTLWQELSKVMELGGMFRDEENFSMPYMHVNFPAEYDPFDFMAVTGKNVRMREEPSLKGKTVASLSYEIVRYLDVSQKPEVIDGESHYWIKVKRKNEEVGYVYGKFVRSPLDYRMNFRKMNGVWKISFFIAVIND